MLPLLAQFAMPMSLTAQLVVLGKMVLAALLGGAVGAEREAANKPAGLRTHMILAGTTALLISISSELLLYSDGTTGQIELQPDPFRLVEAIVTGVAFLGAGTIIRGRGGAGVQGLTTAASLLLVAVIGVAVALNLFVIAVAATLLSLLMLRLIFAFERRVLDQGHGRGSGESSQDAHD